MPDKESNRKFYGKLLLLGEHSIMDGSKAIVLPYRAVSGCLAFTPENSGNITARDSNYMLRDLAKFLTDNQDDHGLQSLGISRFIHDLTQGLYFRSDIPRKYGLGSSGAVCSAVYYEYGPEKGEKAPPDSFDLQTIRKTLAFMESYFHGRSSGVDPLCIFCNMPLVVEGDKVLPLSMDKIMNPEITFFLMDTGLKGNTGDQVKAFREMLLEEGIKEIYNRQYIPHVNYAADQFIQGMLSFDQLLQLSVFQWVFFRRMIPAGFYDVWQYGLDSEYYACKLCGSGGGGYVLGFTDDFEKARMSLKERFKVIPVKLENQAEGLV